ncbi:hypothetical protein PAHAL_2G079400 [Panicum hallii]|jgi:hypothetical protein|uniref:Exocyst subunit Exo70 family protein n=1 Tax=Panicum hallii TaxID=206008 RepID=A0A2T8KND9_9POAL|nr:uncharacterized protein LOC112881575 isoform X1 [Panicum hallii]XP_025802120.1 uncharacterized protein LOC112881575 isoform X1 [Panicum hallii]PVH63662.1 hypothetical protein PAHAL_2G079400 [Panicum hallii]
MGQRLAVESTSEDQLVQRPATADVDSPWSSYGSSIRSISFPQGVGWSAWLRRSGGTTPGSSLPSSCTDGSRPSSSASSWGSGAAGFNAIKANELRSIARRMVHDGHLQALSRAFARSGNGVVRRWFTELDVDWVLTMTEDMPWWAERTVVHDRARRWIRAFTTMAHAFLALSSDLTHAVDGASVQKQLLGEFASASISKMMLFVEAVIANVDWTPENLPAALDVYACISDATASSHDQASSTAQQIVLSMYGGAADHAGLVTSRRLRLAAALSMYGGAADHADHAGLVTSRRRRLAAAIHRAIRSLSVDYYGDGGSCRAPQGSEVHAVTRYTMDFVRLLWRNAGLASSVLDDDGGGSVVSVASDVMRRWEFSLASASMLLPDAALRCVFLLNNYDAMAEAFPDSGLQDEIGRCVERYLDAAWAPALSCLHGAAAWHSPPSAKLADFAARFRRTYDAQKLWRVPSPALRGRLRRAVAGLVVSAYAMYLEEHPLRDEDRASIMAPEEMEEILNELFEG